MKGGRIGPPSVVDERAELTGKLGFPLIELGVLALLYANLRMVSCLALPCAADQTFHILGVENFGYMMVGYTHNNVH